MSIRVFFVLVVCLFFSSSLLAETYIREYTYKASEADSKLSSRAIALDQVKVLLLQEIGTHIRQKINITKNGSGSTYAEEDIEAITAGLTKVDILEEKWNGETYYLKASVRANAQRVINALEEFKKVNTEKNRKQLEALKQNESELRKSREEIKRLKEELINVKLEPQNKTMLDKYSDALNQLSSGNYINRGYEHEQKHEYEHALTWYLKSAEQGNALAQNKVGEMYTYPLLESVQPVELLTYPPPHIKTMQNHSEAVKWFKRAAEQGNAEAQYNLGFAYSIGRGVEVDYSTSNYWYEKACEKGRAVACSQIELNNSLIKYKKLIKYQQ